MGEGAQGALRAGAPATGPGLPAGYLEDVIRVARIFETLGILQEATAGLKSTTGSHAEEIKELTQRVYVISYIKRDVAKNTKDLNRLEERHTKELIELERQVNGLGRRHTTGLSDLGIALRREIGDLRSKLDTGENIFRIFLGALVVAVPIVWAIVSHHVSLAFH